MDHRVVSFRPELKEGAIDRSPVVPSGLLDLVGPSESLPETVGGDYSPVTYQVETGPDSLGGDGEPSLDATAGTAVGSHAREGSDEVLDAGRVEAPELQPAVADGRLAVRMELDEVPVHRASSVAEGVEAFGTEIAVEHEGEQ